MRLWTIHPKHLDAKGLVALWRETLLAKHVFEDKTKAYKNHPQLDRFKALPQPLKAIHQYLSEIYKEAQNRGYNFNVNKFEHQEMLQSIPVTRGQVAYEREHLLNKLKTKSTSNIPQY